MSATGSAREAGTTLLEALVVISITAMIAGAIFPAVKQTLDVLALRQSATVLVANLRLQRAQALLTGRATALAVTGDGSGYAWGGGEARLSRGVQVSPAGARVVFYPDGASSGAAMNLSGARRRLDVAVDDATGAIRIER